MPTNGSTEDRSALALVATLIAVGAFLLSALGLVVVSTKDAGTSSATTAAAAPIPVTLTEFKITPAALSAKPGDVTLAITNNGTMVHNVALADGSKKSADIQPGKTGTLDLGTLAAGTYNLICAIPGHADSGMKATLVVAEGGGAAVDTAMAGMEASANPTPEEYKAMDTKMKAGMEAGLAAFTKAGGSTKGVGNVKMPPSSVEADGTKVFNIEASIVDWEVSPGKVVKAWAYNGMVPGPWIRTEPNDKVKIVLKNSLPVSTDMHTHGISTPFDMDGIAPLTQPYIDPGQTFTYSWTNPNTYQLGMYHAHMNGAVAVPNGLFAVFQIGDIPLPAGRTISGYKMPADLKVTQELPLVLNDAGTIGLSINGKEYPGTTPIGAKPGDVILAHYYNEGLLNHPMHLHHVLQLVVAKDGVALDQPYYADTILIGPGERYSVLVMPTADDIGVWAWHCHILSHAENADGLFGMVTALAVSDPNKPAA